MSTIDPDTLILVGICGPAHGIKGEVKVIPETDDPERLLALKQLWIGMDRSAASPFAVQASRLQTTRHGLTLLAHLEGISDRTVAETFKRRKVYALEEDLPGDNGEMYVHDLIGLRAMILNEDDSQTEAGEVVDVLEGIAQDLLVVRRDGLSDVLVPDVDEFVVDVDLDAGILTLRPPEGLFD